jgi:uncharacterized protein
MTPQERDLILSVAQRLRSTQLTDKDLEAERFIQNEIGSQRDALYLLTQAVIVQEQGLRHAQERIQQLERDLQIAQQQATGAAAQPHRGFLGGLFGGSQPAAAPPQPAAPPGAAAPPPMVPGGGGGAGTFRKTAAGAAAGVVGGQLIWQGLHNMFGGAHGSGSFFGGPAGAAPAGSWGGDWSAPATTGRPLDAGDSGIRDANYGGGGDFGAQEQDTGNDQYGGGGDFGNDASDEDDGGGGDFGDDDQESGGGGDFGNDDDNSSGGDF